MVPTMPKVLEQFREEHREARDCMLEIMDCIQKGDIIHARATFDNFNKAACPHFVFEEECFYPALQPFLGDYTERLYVWHDHALDNAKALGSLLQKKSIRTKETKEAMDLVRKLIVYITSCDGLAIIAEKLSPEKFTELKEVHEKSKDVGVPLLEWAKTMRKK